MQYICLEKNIVISLYSYILYEYMPLYSVFNFLTSLFTFNGAVIDQIPHIHIYFEIVDFTKVDYKTDI
jgi:hypothetical protein